MPKIKEILLWCMQTVNLLGWDTRDEELREVKNERTRLLKQLEKLAQCRVNDAVKLAFLDETRLEEVDGLDLTALTEFRRSEKGGSEVKLVDRVAVLKLLVGLSAGQEEQKAADFFQAWEGKAEGKEAP